MGRLNHIDQLGRDIKEVVLTVEMCFLIVSHKIVEFDRVIAKCIFLKYMFWDFFRHKYCLLM